MVMGMGEPQYTLEDHSETGGLGSVQGQMGGKIFCLPNKFKGQRRITGVYLIKSGDGSETGNS